MAITYDQWKSGYQGKVNPATGNVWQYGDVAQATGMQPADIERFGLGAQQSAWNQNVAGGTGAYGGQPLWMSPYSGGSAYQTINHNVGAPSGATNLAAGYVNPQQWQSQQVKPAWTPNAPATTPPVTPPSTLKPLEQIIYSGQGQQPPVPPPTVPTTNQWTPYQYQMLEKMRHYFTGTNNPATGAPWTDDEILKHLYTSTGLNPPPGGFGEQPPTTGAVPPVTNDGAAPGRPKPTPVTGDKALGVTNYPTDPYDRSYSDMYQWIAEHPNISESDLLNQFPFLGGWDQATNILENFFLSGGGLWGYGGYNPWGGGGEDNSGGGGTTPPPATNPDGRRDTTNVSYGIPGAAGIGSRTNPNQRNIEQKTTGGIVPGGGAPSIAGTTPRDLLTSAVRTGARSGSSIIGGLTQNPTANYPALSGDIKAQAEQYLKNYANTANAGLNDIGYNPQSGYSQWYGNTLGQDPNLQSGSTLSGQLNTYNTNTGDLANYYANAAKTGGLTPEYVAAQKALVYDPMQEQLLTSLNQMGGGQAQLNSPLFAELQRRGVEQFNNQLLSQAQQNIGTYGNLANQGYSNQLQGTSLLSNVQNNAQKNLLDWFQTQNQWNLGSQQMQTQLATTLISGLFNDMASQRQMDAQSKQMWGQILGFTINSIDDVLGALGKLGIL